MITTPTCESRPAADGPKPVNSYVVTRSNLSVTGGQRRQRCHSLLRRYIVGLGVESLRVHVRLCMWVSVCTGKHLKVTAACLLARPVSLCARTRVRILYTDLCLRVCMCECVRVCSSSHTDASSLVAHLHTFFRGRFSNRRAEIAARVAVCQGRASIMCVYALMCIHACRLCV